MVDGGVDRDVDGCADRSAAIAGFAAILRELRQSVGNPSFREMSGRSRAISHTTLHEAAQGNRLPSWATTVEFVKACDGDPTDYRDRWDDANRRVRAAPGKIITPADRDHEPLDAEDEPAPAAPASRRRPMLIGVAAVVAVAVAVLGTVPAGRNDDTGGGPDGASTRPKDLAAGSTTAAAQFRSADCPVHPKNPPPAPPTHPGDHGRLVYDVTVPDCSHVARGSTFVKIWRMRNLGSVPWRGYVLHRFDQPVRRDNCQTITDVPIPNTKSGDFVDVRAQVTAPSSPTFCVVRFRVYDSTGVDAFPGGRSINLQVNVD